VVYSGGAMLLRAVAGCVTATRLQRPACSLACEPWVGTHGYGCVSAPRLQLKPSLPRPSSVRARSLKSLLYPSLFTVLMVLVPYSLVQDFSAPQVTSNGR
jgi:hypothetical protein